LEQAKSFEIPKQLVWAAYRQVRSRKGAGGVDQVELEDYERDLKDNLYKLWNRMSSGSYFPAPVRLVEIPKPSGGLRPLGIPTIQDRIAQTVVKLVLEPLLEPHFHEDSYGYRPRKSAIDAVGVARRRCWRNDWVLDLDVKGFFDNIDHELLLKALRRHTQSRWVLLYIERWLTAPQQRSDGTLVPRDRGTPQGGVISPLLANLFLHYVFDAWMAKYHPNIPFERFADDLIAHCRSERQAQWLLGVLKRRFAECELELHPTKTRIVYCKDDDRPGSWEHESFTFLGYEFRPRRAKNRHGRYFVSFLPAVSPAAAKAFRDDMRRWHLHLRSDKNLSDLSRMFNPILRGWINYFRHYYKSALYPTLRVFDQILMRWATRKYKRLRRHRRRAVHWLGRIARREPDLFAHWAIGVRPATG
jgi:RNA-directed DNA polymerase